MSASSDWLSVFPSWLVQTSEDERTRQHKTQSELRQSQRDLMRQKAKLETQKTAMAKAAESHLKRGDVQRAKAQYTNVARVDRDIQELEKCLGDVTTMSNSTLVVGGRHAVMRATDSMTRAMTSGPGFEQQRQALQSYAAAKEQQKMNNEMFADMAYGSEDEEDEDGESVAGRAEEMMNRAQDRISLASGSMPFQGEDFISIPGAPQIPTQSPADLIRERRPSAKNRQ